MSWLSGGPAHTCGSRVAGPAQSVPDLSWSGAGTQPGPLVYCVLPALPVCCGGSLEELCQLAESFATLQMRALGNSVNFLPGVSREALHVQAAGARNTEHGCSGSSAPPRAGAPSPAHFRPAGCPCLCRAHEGEGLSVAFLVTKSGFQAVDAAY